jgi:hypothetical protein
MSNERMDDAAVRLNVRMDALADHLWEQGVPTQDPGVELTPSMIEAAEAFAARFAPVALEVSPQEPVEEAGEGEGEAVVEASAPSEEPAEVQLQSGVRRRRRRLEGDG